MFKYLGLTLIVFFSFYNSFSQIKNQESENGYNIFYYPNGQVSSEGNMINGKPDGIWKAYYVDGTLKSIGIRRNSSLDSVWIFYNEKGKIKEKINYYKGKKNGYFYSFKSYYNQDSIYLGFLKSQELYVQNKKNGLSLYYYANGQIYQEVPYKDNLKHGTAKMYNPSGVLNTLIEYRYGKEVDREEINRFNDSLKNGIWKEFYPNGKLKREYNYKNGVLNGLIKDYDLSGDLLSVKRYLNGELKDTALTLDNEIKIVEEFFNLKDSTGELIKKKSGGFIDGKPIGVHREFDSLGRVVASRIFDKDGNLIGEGIVNIEGDKVGDWKFYYSNHILKSKGRYHNNRRVGPWVYYYSKGNIEQKGHFRNGIPDGKWFYYFESGSLNREENYRLGKEDGESTEYDELGLIIASGFYERGHKIGVWKYNFYFHTEEGEYINNYKSGRWVYKYSSGDIYFEGNFVEGYEDGKHIFYHKNGNIKEIRFYLFGRRIKNWEYYDYYGSLLKILTFENDKLIKIDGISVITD